MRNIFVEGVRSAFIRIIRMLVYIVIGLIIFYIIGLFTSNKVHALVYKQNIGSNPGFTNRWAGATVGSWGDGKRLDWEFSSSFQVNHNYDLLAIQFSYFNITYSSGITISNNSQYCERYAIDNTLASNPVEHVYTQIRCTSTTGSTSDTGTINNQGDDFYSYYGVAEDSNGTRVPIIFSDDLKDTILIPIKDINDIKYIRIWIRNHGASNLNVSVELENIKFYYNYDSTEIVNGLTGVQQAQQQTITIIQQQTQEIEQQNQYMQSDNVTSSMTSANSSFTIMTNEITQQLGSANELTQIVIAPVSMFMELATDSCSPLILNVPFVNVQAIIPCMKPVFNQYFAGLYTIFTTAISAIITYWVSVKTFSLIKDILDCDNDRIEVLDL